MADYIKVGTDGEITFDLANCTREQWAAVQSLQIDRFDGQDERGKPRVHYRIKFRLWPKAEALREMCKLFGWIEERRGELDGIAAKLRAMTPEQREEDARQLMLRVRAALAKHAPLIEQMPEDEEPPEP